MGEEEEWGKGRAIGREREEEWGRRRSGERVGQLAGRGRKSGGGGGVGKG